MNTRKMRWAVLALAAVVALLAGAQPAAAQEGSRYERITLSGRLTEGKGVPLAGATLRLISTAADGGTFEAVTDPEGRYRLERIPYGIYAMEIDTADGERIYGINTVPLSMSKQEVAVQMKVSDRLRTTTTLENRPIRFVAWVEDPGINWKKFWKELALFLGLSAGLGAAAL